MPNSQTVKASVLGLLFFAFAVVHLSQSGFYSNHKKDYNPRRTTKMVAPLQIYIQKQESKSVEVGDTVTLIANINSISAVGRVRWEWKAGPGVELLDTTSGFFDVSAPDQEHSLQVRFKQLSDKNEFVHLKIFSGEGRPQVVGAFSYSTLEQEKIEAESEEIVERQREYQEYMEQEGQTVLSSESETKNKFGHDH